MRFNLGESMFLLGILSLLQIIIIPGLVILKLFRVKTVNIIQSFLFSLGLSLYANYLFVLILTWLKIYTQMTVFSLFAAEIIILGYFYVKQGLKGPGQKTIKEYYLLFRTYIQKMQPLHKFVFLSSCMLMLFFISLIPVSTGTTYYFTDSLLHWTRWPLAWANNSFPTVTSHYPQLFPTNLSIIYIFTAQPGLQFFQKALMPVFFLGILLMFFDLSLKKHSLVHLTGFIIYSLFLIIFYNLLFILEVNADIPVSFFAFLTFYTILREEKKGFDVKTIILVTIFASSAADTKLAGAYILCIAGLWVLYIFYKYRKTISRKDFIKIVISLFLVLCGSILWYLVRPVDMVSGLDQSVYLLPSYGTRFVRAVNMLFYSAGPIFFVFISICLLASLFTKEARLLVIFIVAPSSILWAFFFSTDFRNLSFAIPFIAYCSSYGLQYLNAILVNQTKAATTTGVTVSQSKAATGRNNYLLKDKLKNKRKLIFSAGIIILIAVFILAGTDSFFNLILNSAHILNRFYFNKFRVVSVTEIGYYKYAEYYSASIRVFCILLLLILALKYSKVKLSYLIVLLTLAAAFLNFTLLKKENIKKHQEEDLRMVDIHNLHFLIYQFTHDSGKTNQVMTNSTDFLKIVIPSQIKLKYVAEIEPKTLTSDSNNNYLLIDLGKLNMATKDFIDKKTANKEFSVCFQQDQYLFLRTMK
jgi:hypothetical protein